MTLHSFSFGHHYDPDNLAFGPLRAFDDHVLEAGAGFDEHRHSDVELVTWVQSGTLVHTGPDGVSTALAAGSAQVQSAGAGIVHTERAAPGSPTRFVQSWLVPDEAGLPPVRRVGTPSGSGPFRQVAGEGTDLPVGSVGAILWQGTLEAGVETSLPRAGSLLLFVLEGVVEVRSTQAPTGLAGLTGPAALAGGDALRATDTTRTDALHAFASVHAQVLLWTFEGAPPAA